MKEKIANEIEIENERDKNLYMQGYEQAQKILDELKGVRPDKLKGEAKKLFEAIMRIADDRDKLKQEFDAVDHECSRLEQKEIELEKEIEERDKIINMMAEYIFYNQDFKFQGYHSIQDVKEYFAYKAYITYITKKEERNDHRRSEFKSSGKTKKRE